MLNRRLKSVLAGPACALLVAACAADGGVVSPQTAAPERSICVRGETGAARLQVEVADTPSERSLGLMHRQALDRNRGMLFVFDRAQPAGHGFWMVNTKIPLDIAFLDRQGVILAIEQMTPCLEERHRDCPSYAPGRRYHYALEVNRGYFAGIGIGPGARVLLDPGAACTE